MKKFVNFLTIIRIVATFILPFIWRVLNPFLIIVFVSLVLLTDFFDGLLARKFHVQSLFGSLLDTVADKVFGIVIVLIIALYFPIYYIILVLEASIALINLLAAFRGATTKSSFLGRAKMWVLGIAIVFAMISIFQNDLLNVGFLNTLVSLIVDNQELIISSSVFVTAGSELMIVIDYSRRIIKELKNKSEKIVYNFKSEKELKYVLFDTEYYLSHKNLPYSKHLLK